MYKRRLTPLIEEALNDTPAVLIGGARQTGKSTLAKSLIGASFDAQYFSFDNANTLATAKLDPIGFIEGLEGPVVLDEKLIRNIKLLKKAELLRRVFSRGLSGSNNSKIKSTRCVG